MKSNFFLNQLLFVNKLLSFFRLQWNGLPNNAQKEKIPKVGNTRSIKLVICYTSRKKPQKASNKKLSKRKFQKKKKKKQQEKTLSITKLEKKGKEKSNSNKN